MTEHALDAPEATAGAGATRFNSEAKVGPVTAIPMAIAATAAEAMMVRMNVSLAQATLIGAE